MLVTANQSLLPLNMIRKKTFHRNRFSENPVYGPVQGDIMDPFAIKSSQIYGGTGESSFKKISPF